MPSKIKTLKNFGLFLILASLVSGCASGSAAPKQAVPYDADWKFSTVPGETIPRACLNQMDVIKLRETLVRCGYDSK